MIMINNKYNRKDHWPHMQTVFSTVDSDIDTITGFLSLGKHSQWSSNTFFTLCQRYKLFE